MIDCQHLKFSPSLAKQRLSKAEQIFGVKILRRLICFVLYLLGVNRRAIADLLSIPLDSTKSIIKAVERDGLPAFEDRRQRVSSFLSPCTQKTYQIKVQKDTDWLTINFGYSDKALRIPLQNMLQVKVVLLSLLNSGLLSIKETSHFIEYTPEHTSNLAKNLQTEGISALLDKRKGQTRDYRVNAEVKANLIQQFILDLVAQGNTSGKGLSERLQSRCDLNIPERTVRYHLKELGLSQIKESLPQLLSALKKNSSLQSHL